MTTSDPPPAMMTSDREHSTADDQRADPDRQRAHLDGMTPHDLAAHLRSHGVPVQDDEARRIIAHTIYRGEPGFPQVQPVSRRVEVAVEALVQRTRPEIVEREEDPADHVVRYLLRSGDGALFEAVRIPLEKQDRYTVCLSSQVGCAMGCVFCATGRLGAGRNLEPWEMVGSLLQVRADSRGQGQGQISGVVFQGQGEPLLNLDAVLQAVRVLSHPCGGQIKGSAISISTCGVVPAIRRYTAGRHRPRLIVSLCSTIQSRRDELMPGAARWPLQQLVAALRDHATATRRHATVAWVLLGGVNHGPGELDGLRRIHAQVPLRLNLIDFNGHTHPETNVPRPEGLRRATAEERTAFLAELRELNIPVVRRYSGGANTHAACGMLNSRRRRNEPRAP